MANTLLRWLIPGLVAVGGGTAIALAATSGAMTSDLLQRSAAALVPDAGWAHVQIDGRDALLTGSATSDSDVDKAVTALSSVPGIGSVTADVQLAKRISPYPFAATLYGGVLTLSGGYPTEEIHAVLLSEAGTSADTTQLLGGAPDITAFSAGAKFGLDVLRDLDQGSMQLADLSLTIKGRARSVGAYQQLQTIAADVPPGITLAQAVIAPPIASPYTWTATYDGTGLRIEGDEPDAGLANRLRAAIPATIPVDFALMPASGDPAAFEPNTLALLESLLLLESGKASVTDTTITLSGSPATSAVADQVAAAVTAIGGTAALDAPQSGEFELMITKSAAALAFSGTVPDKATRLKLAALDKAGVTKLELGHGAPGHFADALQFGLEALTHLASGQVDLRGSRIAIDGVAATATDFKALNVMLAQAPAGFTVSAAAVHPAVATPFTWSATKAADGTISTAGFVPDDAARATLNAKLPGGSKDVTEPAGGAPDGFAQSAAKGLDVLVLLDTGKVSFDGTNWSIEGAVDSVKKAFAADAAYSITGLRTAGWNYVLHKPSLPTITPYVWNARKNVDGAVGLTGYSPDETFQQDVKARLPNAKDESSLGLGAPGDFKLAALAGLDALSALEDGSLALNGSNWSLSGTAADSATRDAVQAKLKAATNTAAWSIAITAKDTAPVVTPYLWSATKTSDGNTALAGYVPGNSVKADAEMRAGKVSSDTTAIASGEPAGFVDNIAAGLDALGHLTSGRAMFDGNRWSLAGNVASQADGEATIAAVAKASPAGGAWNVTLGGYTPPPASSGADVSAISSSPATSSVEDAVASDITSIAPLVPPPDIASTEPSSAVTQVASEAASSLESATVSSSSVEGTSSASASSSEAPSVESSSSASMAQLSSSSAEAPPPSSAIASSSAEPVQPDASLPPLPDTLVFEASLDAGGPVVLKGKAPAAADIKAIGKAAGGVSTKSLSASPGLPDGFTTSATGGIAVLSKLAQGRLGFDGTRWWLRANAYTGTARDAATAAVAAIPGGSDWSVGISVLAPLDACRTKVSAIAKANSIQFTGRAALTKPSLAVIDDLAATLQACTATNVHVQGHTDSDGNAQANLGVSVARAEAVIAELVKQGVDEGRLYAEGFGESDPVASNDTKPGKAANRRVTFEINPQ